MYNSTKIAERIKQTAKNKGVSIKKLLEDVGLNFNTITMMKKYMPRSDSLGKIADYLDCSVDYLLGRIDEQKAFEDETELIQNYRSLNKDGKEQVYKYTKNLTKMDEYKKCNTSEDINAG